jgi:hypothetical protein
MSRKQLNLFLVGVIILISLVAFPIFGQDAASQAWTAPKFLGNGWWQSLALDQEQNLHVTWYGNYDSGDNIGHDVMTYVMRDSTGSWSPPSDVIYTGDGGYTVRNALAVTSDGILHAAFRGVTNHFVSSAPVHGATSAENWSPQNQVGGVGYYLDMIAGRDDTLHLVLSDRPEFPGGGTGEQGSSDVFAEGAKCFLCFDLFYRRSTDGGQTWTDFVPISLEADTGSDRPQIQQGASGRLYITWDEGLDWYSGRGQATDVRMVYSDDQGLTWSKPIIFDGGALADRKPIQGALTELRDGSLMMVWRYSTNADRHIFFQLSSNVGQTWTEPAPIPGIFARDSNATGLDHYNLITDRLGIVHLFAVGQTNLELKRNDQLYDVTYVPSSNYWVEPQRIYYSADERPEWPEAVVGASNDIHLVWFNRGIVPGSSCNTCILKVYYSYLPGNMVPEPTRAFRPTQTPLPTATVFQNIEPTTTPFPTLEGVASTLIVNTQDNYAAQTLLGGMFMSALFCGAVVLFIRLRR